MATKTLYIKEQDENIWAEAEDLTKESASSLVTRLLKQEVERLKERKAKLSGTSERIVVKVQESDCIPRNVAFQGRWLFDDLELEDGVIYSVAITEKQKLFVLQEEARFGSHYDVYDSLEEMVKNESQKYPAELFHWISARLESDYVEELDI